MEDMKYLGLYDMKVSVGIHGMEEPEPFRVNTWNFNTGTGLYVLSGYENESDRELLDELFEGLQYTGIGGKKSSGLGRFIYKVCKVPEDMMGYLKKKSEKNILLSTALPEDGIGTGYKRFLISFNKKIRICRFIRICIAANAKKRSLCFFIWFMFCAYIQRKNH